MTFPVKHLPSATRGNVNGGQLAHSWLEFEPKIRWILSHSAAENHSFLADTPGLTGLVLSFSSVFSPSDSTIYKQFLLREGACYPLVFGTPAPLVDFVVSRFVVSFLGPDHNCNIYFVRKKRRERTALPKTWAIFWSQRGSLPN